MSSTFDQWNTQKWNAKQEVLSQLESILNAWTCVTLLIILGQLSVYWLTDPRPRGPIIVIYCQKFLVLVMTHTCHFFSTDLCSSHGSPKIMKKMESDIPDWIIFEQPKVIWKTLILLKQMHNWVIRVPMCLMPCQYLFTLIYQHLVLPESYQSYITETIPC